MSEDKEWREAFKQAARAVKETYTVHLERGGHLYPGCENEVTVLMNGAEKAITELEAKDEEIAARRASARSVAAYCSGYIRGSKSIIATLEIKLKVRDEEITALQTQIAKDRHARSLELTDEQKALIESTNS